MKIIRGGENVAESTAVSAKGLTSVILTNQHTWLYDWLHFTLEVKPQDTSQIGARWKTNSTTSPLSCRLSEMKTWMVFQIKRRQKKEVMLMGPQLPHQETGSTCESMAAPSTPQPQCFIQPHIREHPQHQTSSNSITESHDSDPLSLTPLLKPSFTLF